MQLGLRNLHLRHLGVRRNQSLLSIFESRLFKIIDSQNSLFKDLELVFDKGEHKVVKIAGNAVDALEDHLQSLKDESSITAEDIEYAITEDIDTQGHMFSILRKFYVGVKLIDIQLTTDRGFSELDKKEYLELLINFSDFELLRLIMIGMKYCKYSMAISLAENIQLRSALKELGYLDYLNEI